MVELAFLDGLTFAALEPVVDANYIAGVASRSLHILSAIVLGGGLFYMCAVLAPGGAEACYAGRRAVWAKWVGVATLLLLATGFYNFWRIFNEVKDAGEKLAPSYHMLFGVKVLLALLVMFIASILAGKTAGAERFRAHLSRWLIVAGLAVLAIVVIAAVLRTYH